MPDDIDEPVISKQDASAQPIMWIAFFSDRYDTRELTQIADDMVKDRLQTVPGVSSVIIGGEKQLAMRIWLDAGRMAAHKVTVLDVERALLSQNIELPSGRVENVDRELTVRTMGQLSTPDEFEALILRQEGTRVVKLGDVAWVETGVEDLRSIARYNGNPSVGLGVVRQSKANTLTVASQVKERMAGIAPSLPPGIEYDFPYDESLYVEAAVIEVWQTLAIAFGLVVLVIFVFLRNLRSTLIPSIAIPVSILSTFGVLYLLGYSINIFTLLALVLAIGLVVDDAVVVLENVYRHVEEGMAPIPAAVKAMREIAFAVIATTLSLISVFLPLTFIGGLTGRLLLEFAVSLATAVAVSSVVALTLTPMVAARVLKPVDPSTHGKMFNFFERRFDRLNRRYERSLGWALRHRVIMVCIAVAALGLAVHFYRMLDSEFLPEEDKSRMLVLCLTPEGSTPEYTDRMLTKAENVLADTPEVKSYFSAAALPFNGPGDPTFGIAFVRLVDGKRKHIRDVVGGPAGIGARFMGEIEGALTFPIMPKAVDLTFGQPFSLVITHPDLSELNDYVEQLTGQLLQSGYLANVRSTFSLTKPEMRVGVDRDRAGALGVSVRDISRTLQVLLGGQDLSDIKLDGKQYEVIAQLERESRLKPSDLERLYVRNERGELVQLSNVVRWESGAGPNTIERFQRRRAATIEATPVGVTLGTAVDRTEALLRAELPPGYGFDWKGDARNLRASSRDLYFFMLLAVIVVYMVLAAQFESFVHPFTVLLALPLAFLGAFFLLYLLGWVDWLGNMLYGWANYAPDAPGAVVFLSKYVPRISSMNMNIFSQVGLILLIGLVTKNSILLVEFANQQMARGANAAEAMLAAGKIRLRPILMTSFSTIAGILPIAIGFGEAAESRRPLGVVAVGGMITSTLLTLFVIPVFYTLFSDLSLKLTGTPAGLHTEPGNEPNGEPRVDTDEHGSV
jgi:hydrophobe/amphiphile efflux-1 (HAE1) family protein